MSETKSSLEEKVNLIILKDDFSLEQTDSF